jgi:hypothetical protein
MNRHRVQPVRAAGCLLPALLALALPADAAAQSGKRVPVGRATGKIALDGVLDEPD